MRFVFCLIQIALLLFVVAPVAGSARAQADERTAIGQKIGDVSFVDIRTLERSLSEFGERDALVLVFTTTTCPLVQRYLPRLKALHERFGDRVQFVAINVGAADSIRAVAAHGLESGALFPFVKDRDGSCADAVGVTRTPEVAVLDRERRLVYRGRIDDQYRLGGALPAARRDDLAAALEELLAGREISVPTTPVDGCLITRPDGDVSARSVTYHRDVAPIVEASCATCHRPGTAAPFPLQTFEQVRSHGSMVAEVVELERMPPWYANPAHGRFQNDRSLTAEQRATIVRWVESGMPAGVASDPAAAMEPGGDVGSTTDAAPEPDSATSGSGTPDSTASGTGVPESVDPAASGHNAEPAKSASGWTIGKPDLIVPMILDHRIPADGFVSYRYVALPYLFARETWIEAIEIRPDNRTVVHHANLAYGAPGHEPGLSTFITGYVPGGQAMNLTHFDNDVAFKVPPYSVLGLQIHYVTTGKPERCRIAVGLRFKRGKVKKQLRFRLADPRRFSIPPNHPAYPVRKSFQLKHDVSILGFFAHMHLRGKDMTFLAHRPDGSTETMLQIPNYSFDWQHGYEVRPGDVRLPRGSRIEVIAHYDNSRFNPYNPDPERAVRYGPQTVHEMMNGYVFFTRDDESLDLDIDPATGWVRDTASATPAGGDQKAEKADDPPRR
ncbi:MAG: redoxin family protein [Planctomycetota bacterium]